MNLPRLVVAAPGSGHGKTMIATGLMAALRGRGLEVSPHKVGPDYIDPSYHGLAAGRVGRNLDPFLQDESRIVPLLLHGATTPRPADLAVIEGVMGLFDGALGTGGFASTAHVARLVGAPVVLVVDCAAAARSVGAIVHGFATYDEQVRVAGVILNNVASARHEQEARDAIGLPVLGVVPRLPDVVVPSRHLGLVPVAERAPEAVAAVEALAGLIAEHVDLDAVIELARTAPGLGAGVGEAAGVGAGVGAGEAAEPWSPSREVAQIVPRSGTNCRPRVAVFGGPAFSFTYAENVELLEAAGADVVLVDPLRDPALPSGTAALVAGGGFPEVHVDRLGANTSLLAEVAAFVRRGGPVVAECAGLLYLGRALDGVPMTGALPMTGAMTKRLTLGYRRATALADSPVARIGERVTGHEFHRTAVTWDHDCHLEGQSLPPRGTRAATSAWGWRVADGSEDSDAKRGGGERVEGWASPNVHASYLHVHWAGYPQHAVRLVEAARARVTVTA